MYPWLCCGLEGSVDHCQILFDQFYKVGCFRASLHTSMPSLCGMFVYSDVTSICRVTSMVSSGRLFGKDCSFNRMSVACAFEIRREGSNMWV